MLYDRDLSWLSFNYRVLWEARDHSLPLYERIKFLAIFASNLDEFYKVRVASIQSLDLVKKKVKKKLLISPKSLLSQIFNEVHRQQIEFGNIFQNQILPDLAEHGIHLLQSKPRQTIHTDFIKDFFEKELMPFLHPEVLIKGKIKHFLRDESLYLAVHLQSHKQEQTDLDLGGAEGTTIRKQKSRYAIIQIPTHYFGRFISLPNIDGQYYYMFLDDVIRYHLSIIFPGYAVLESYSIKLNRNADLQIEDEFKGNLVEKIRESLIRRQTGIPARFLYDADMPEKMLRYLQETFGLRKKEMMPGARYHHFKDFFAFPNPIGKSLERKAFPPLADPRLDAYSNMFEAIRQRDHILHFPYQRYDYFLRFLQEAAQDPAVARIQTTQYRVANRSAIVGALIRAAKNGKKVSVFVELKARFDEASNLQTAQEMEEAGVRIIYSIPGLKVHAKVALVTRQEEQKEKGYAFLSTGNFNEKTARIYADHGLFTGNTDIIGELNHLFKHLEDQQYQPPAFQHLLVAQFNMREDLLAKINREIQHAQAGKPAYMLIKLNGLEDKKMIKALYQASQAGVNVDLIVRGICCLRPGIPGLSERVRVIRLVDQFLEHARVIVFHNLGEDELFLASADWMKRNLSSRIEVGFPVLDSELKAEILEILQIQLKDNQKAVRLDDQIQNIPISTENQPPVRAQWVIYDRISERNQKF